MIHTTHFKNRMGELFVAASPRGLLQLHMIPKGAVGPILKELSGTYPDAAVREGGKPLEPILEEIREYFSGERKEFSIALDLKGTPFQMAVWDELQRIPYGETRSYGEVAAKIGKSKAARAVGMACNRNPIAIVVPCHRVVGAKGDLTGYAFGLKIKARLLELERRVRRKEDWGKDNIAKSLPF